MKISIVKDNINKYDTITNKHNSDIKEVAQDCFIIKYDSRYWIISILENLYGFLSDGSIKKEIIFDIEDNHSNKEILIINDVISFYDDDYKSENKYDCYYDIYSNIMIIKYSGMYLEKIICENKFFDLESYSFEKEFFNKYLGKKYNVFENNSLKSNIEIIEDFSWTKKYLILPEIPSLIAKSNNRVNIGSIIYESDIQNSDIENIEDIKNKIIGIVLSYIKEKDEFIINLVPTCLILKSLERIKINQVVLLNSFIEYFKLRQKYNTYLVKESYYNKYYTQDDNGKIIEMNIKIFDSKTLLYNIDDKNIDEDGFLEFEKKIPLKSYIFLFKNPDCQNSYSLKYKKMIKDNKSKDYIECDKTNIIYIQNNGNYGINVSEFNYINYKAKYIVELNEMLLYELICKNMGEPKFDKILLNIVKNMYQVNKILLYFELSKDHLEKNIFTNLSIIKNYKNIFDIKEKLTTKNKIIKFIQNIVVR